MNWRSPFWCWTLVAAFAACGDDPAAQQTADANAADGTIVFGGGDTLGTDDTVGTPDSGADNGSQAADSGSHDALVDGGAGADASASDAAPITIASVTITAPATLELGTTAKIIVAATRLDGGKADVSAAGFTVNGAALAVGPALAKDPKNQPNVAIWEHKDAATWQLAGARPGVAQLVAIIDGVASKPVAITCNMPAQPTVQASIPTATGATVAERALDDANTVRITGQSLGGGGANVTLRFPTSGASGDVFDLEAPPSKGGLSVQVGMADLGGSKVSLVKGRLYLDSTANGVFAGTFIGQAASLTPLVGAFLVTRNGKFGIDPLDEKALQVAKSDSATPETGHHHSRVSVGALGADALILHRHIELKLKAEYATHRLDPIAGELDVETSLVSGIATYTGLVGSQPGPFNPALGYADIASNGDKHLMVWEGRSEKGHSKPHGVWARLYDDKLAALTPIMQLDTDPCHGTCRPQVLAQPGRFSVVWASGAGAVKTRALGSQVANGTLSFLAATDTLDNVPAYNVAAAAHGKLVGLVARATGDQFALWDADKKSTKVTTLSYASSSGFVPAIAAVSAPSTQPNQLFAVFKCAGSLQVRSFATTGEQLVATDATGLGPCSGDLQAASGKNSQVILLEVVPANTTYSVRAHKLVWTDYKSPPKVIGEPLELVVFPTGSFITADIAYVVAANAFVIGWAGDLDSTGVWLRRLR